MRQTQKFRGKAKLQKALRELLPRVTMADYVEIENIALRGHLRHLPPTIIAWQAATTHIRHAHTDYDSLLEEGYDQEAARHFVIDDINEKLAEWGCLRRLDERDDYQRG